MAFDIGEEITLVGEFRISGELTDQSEVILQMKQPGFFARQYSLSAGQITRVSAGVYARNVILDKAGRWIYRFTARGTYRGTTGDVVINVDPSEFARV